MQGGLKKIFVGRPSWDGGSHDDDSRSGDWRRRKKTDKIKKKGEVIASFRSRRIDDEQQEGEVVYGA